MRITPGRPRFAFLVVLAAAAGTTVVAQSRRAPTADEAKVLTRLYSAMAAVTGGFADQDWRVSGGTLPNDPSHDSISIHAGVPIDNCVGGDRTWTVADGSPRFNARLKPLYDRVQPLADALVAKIRAGQDAASEKQEIDRLNAQIKSAREVSMDVCANSTNIDAAALAPGTPSLLANVTAHKAPPAVCPDDSAFPCYVLVFGDWKTARLSNGRYNFHFVHPAASPYLENIVIRLHGADDRIQEMLKADWARLTSALGGPGD